MRRREQIWIDFKKREAKFEALFYFLNPNLFDLRIEIRDEPLFYFQFLKYTILRNNLLFG